MTMISCIIPVYNRTAELRRAVESVLVQGVETELIVVENGPTAVAGSALDLAFPKHIRLDYYYLPDPNANEARRFGQARATGDYIQYLDSDDRLGVDKWRQQLAHLAATREVQVSIASTLRESSQHAPVLMDPTSCSNRICLLDLITGRSHPSTGAPLWRAEAAKRNEWPGELASSQDWETHLAALLRGAEMEYCRSATYVITEAATNRIAAMQVGRKARNKLTAILGHIDQLNAYGLKPSERMAIRLLVARLIRVCMRDGVSLRGNWPAIRRVLLIH